MCTKGLSALINEAEQMGQIHAEAVLAMLSTSKVGRLHPIVVEFFTLWRAMQFCPELGIERVRFEGDVQLLINYINTKGECKTWHENLNEDAKIVMKNRPLWSIHFVHREGNKVSHRLAKYGLSLQGESVWIDDIPDFISQLVLDNISNQ